MAVPAEPIGSVTMDEIARPLPYARRETAVPEVIPPAGATFMPQKKPAKPDPPVRTLDELLEECRRLVRRGRELVEQVKVLASDVVEARARSENGRAKRK